MDAIGGDMHFLHDSEDEKVPNGVKTMSRSLINLELIMNGW